MKPRRLKGHTGAVTCCIPSLSRPGIVASSGEDGCICLFDLRCKDVACTIDVSKEPVSSLCFKAGNEDVVYASSGTKISCFDIHMPSAWKPLENYNYNKEEINQIVFSPKSYFLAAADDSGDVKIIDTRQQSLYKTLRAVHLSICSSVQFLSWKPWIAITGDLDSKLAIWDYSKGRVQNIIDYGMPELDSEGTTNNAGQCYNPPFVHSVAVPEVGTLAGLNKVCAVARGDCVVEVMELESEPATTKSRSSSQPKKASSSRGSDVQAANNSMVDPSLRKRLQLDHSLGGHTAAVSCVSFSLFGERGKFLISGGNDSFVKMWSWSRHFIDAYKLLPVPSPIGGVLVICANSIHYHSQSASCSLGLNNFQVQTEKKNSESAQKTFSFVVRDSLVNVGPMKDFSHGLRVNADPNATRVAKQSNYELVCYSGHGKSGALTVLQQSVRPELITQVELPGCRGIWTVYHKSSQSHAMDPSKTIVEDDEYHAYLIISLETRTMVLETADDLGEVTESVDYYVQGSTFAAGNLFGRHRVVQIFGRGARILDGSYMTQELLFNGPTSEQISNTDYCIVSFVSIPDPYVLMRMVDGSIQLLVGDPSSCTVSVIVPAVFVGLTDTVSTCTLYFDKGPEPWLRKASTDAWLSTGITESFDANEGSFNDQGDIYCVVCYESGTLQIFDVPSFKCVFSIDNFGSGKSHLLDTCTKKQTKSSSIPKTKISEEATRQVKKESPPKMKIVELVMQRWPGQHSRPFLFGMLNDGTMLAYRAYVYEGLESAAKVEEAISPDSGSISTSRLRNLRFVRVSIDANTREESSNAVARPRITIFKNIGGYHGFFLAGSRPAWFMVCRERFRIHSQLCDGSIVAFAVLHNVNCNHGLIYVTSQGLLKICQLPSVCNYDNYWPVQKIPLKGTPHQVTYFVERNLYPLILSVPVVKSLNQVLSSLLDQDSAHPMDHDSVSSDDLRKTYTVEEFEVRIMEPEKSGGHWETRMTIPMQTFENALTVRVVTLTNTTTKENETLLAIGTAYVQGEDIAARGRILLFSFGKNTENSQDLAQEVYSKELKGAISALASVQGHLLIASGPKITLHEWTGSDLNALAFFDAPLHVVSLNIVKNFILLGDIHKSIYFLNWKEQGHQLSLLAKDFGSLDCYATEFLIDGGTLSLVVSDDQKNIQIFYYAPKTLESWKGQKLLSRAEFHTGAHVTKFMRLQMLPTSDRTSAAQGSEKTNKFALLFSTLDGSIGCIAPLDELTFRRLQSLQRKLVDVVPHVCGLNPRAFRQFRSNGKAHRPGPDNIVDCELLSHYEMLSMEEQVEIAHQIGTTRLLILSSLSDLSIGTSFL